MKIKECTLRNLLLAQRGDVQELRGFSSKLVHTYIYLSSSAAIMLQKKVQNHSFFFLIYDTSFMYYMVKKSLNCYKGSLEDIPVEV